MVNIDGNAGPLRDHLAFIEQKLDGYDFTAASHAGTLEFPINTNWKFAHENYIEPYHVFAAHPRLHAFVPMGERQASFTQDHVMWNYYQFRSPEEGRGLGLPHFPNLSDKLSRRGIWFLLFPPSASRSIRIMSPCSTVNPVGPDRCVERIAVYLVGEAATATQYAQGRQAVLDTLRDLNKEDIGLLEALQAGRRAPGYDGGTLSPFWDEAPRHFARLVARGIHEQSKLAG